MTLTDEIHCPTCGTELFEIDYDDYSTIEDSGTACPNECGWVEVEQQGESLATLISPCTY